jgi:hypothetical protein
VAAFEVRRYHAAKVISRRSLPVDRQADLNKLVAGWAEKQIKAKSTNLANLRLLFRNSGQQSLHQIIESASDTAVRTLAKNLDPNNAAIVGFSSLQVKMHVYALTSCQTEPLPKLSKPRPVKKDSVKPSGPKKGAGTSRSRGDLLIDSKY